MKTSILFLSMMLPSLALANNLQVQKSAGNFNVWEISASKVKAVSVRLSQTITREDCNQRTINFDLAYVEGNKDFGWYQTNFASASTMMTEMYCPLNQPITETIYSQAIEVKSLINENADGEIKMNLIVPASYNVEVTEVK